jgi:hypothetical protein
VLQAVKFHGKPLYQICRSSQKGERTVEFSVENSRNPASRQISQRSKEVTVVIFLQAEAQEREGRRFTPTRTVGSTREIPFRGFVGGKTETSSFGFAKLRSPKPRQGGKFRSGAQYLDTCRSPSISAFRGFVSRRTEGLVARFARSHERRSPEGAKKRVCGASYR